MPDLNDLLDTGGQPQLPPVQPLSAPPGVKLEPVDHDPFTAAAPSSGALPVTDPLVGYAPPSGNITDPASQKRSPWADSPLAQIGRLIGERGLAGAIPGRTIQQPETMQGFWSRWNDFLSGMKGGTTAPKPKIKLEPVDHDPFAAQPIAAPLPGAGAVNSALPPSYGLKGRAPDDSIVQSPPAGAGYDANVYRPEDVMRGRAIPPQEDI